MKFKYLGRIMGIAACSLCVFLPYLYAQPAKKSLTTSQIILPLDPAVRVGKLANGFTYYLRHNEEPKNRVTLYLANKAGSILEADDQQGLAHFLEHMSFNGTAHFPKNALVDYLQKAGVRFGADINAYTNYDETVYQLPLPANAAGVVDNGLQILRDWAHGAMLETSEIDKERGIILEEKRLRKGAQERMREIYWPQLLNGSRYAGRSPIGTEKVLNTFKPEAIKRFYTDWYRPNMQAIIVVGDVDMAAMEKKIRSLFADLRNPIPSKPRPTYLVPLTGKQQFISVTDKEMTATVVQIMCKQPAKTLITATDYRDAIIRQFYNQMLGRRFAELSRNNPVYMQGNAAMGDLIGGIAAFTVTIVAKPGEIEQGVKAVWKETQKARKHGFTQSELDLVKQAYLANMGSALKEEDKTPSDNFVNEYLQHYLKSTAAPGIKEEFALVNRLLPTITLAEMNAAGEAYMTTKNRDVLIMAPEKEKGGLPTSVQFYRWLREAEDQESPRYQDTATSVPQLRVRPVPGKVTGITRDKELGTVTYTFDNGVKVILKPTTFKNDEISFSAFAPGGTSLYSDQEFQSASNASAIISSFGAGNLDANQLSRYLADKQLQVQPYIAERTQGISGAAVVKDIETALQLVYARITAPRLDTAQFRGMISRGKASLLNRGNNPNSVFQDTISAVLGAQHVRRTGPSIAKLEQIDIKRAYHIYKERFADASAMTFVFIGNIDTLTLRPLLEKYLGGLPATHTPVEARDLNIQIPAGKIERIVYKGSEDRATVRLVFAGDLVHTMENSIQLEALKEVLQIRLLERLREDEGGVYSPGVYATSSKQPKGRYTFNIAFGCSTGNVNKLVASTLDEIRKLKTSGPTQVNVDKFLAEEKLQQETMLKSNEFWLDYLTRQLQNNEALNDYLRYADLLKTVTPDSIKTAAARYLDERNYVKFVLLPENSRR
jgi:zinc protease